MLRKIGLGLGCCAGISFGGLAMADASLHEWLDEQQWLTSARLLDNVSPRDAKPGAVVAATSRSAPNYFSNWVRDSALVMLELADKYERGEYDAALLRQRFLEYLDYSQHIQGLDNPAGRAYEGGLGEVRFNPDGSAFTQAWGRPQNDGPALRALSMIKIYHLIAEGQLETLSKDKLLDRLYSTDLADRSIIKADLEYIAHRWKDPCFDLWEEIKGQHFYTLMAIRAALSEGAKFALERRDPHAADFYEQVSLQVADTLEAHWIESKSLIAPTLRYSGGLSGKTADLDVSVLLAALHVGSEELSFHILDPRIIRSATTLLRSMNSLYAINARQVDHLYKALAPAVGRYPEDVYDGHSFSGGNPWFLTTLAYAEWTAKIARTSQKRRVLVSPELADYLSFFGYDFDQGSRVGDRERKALLEIAQRFFRRVRLHSDPRDPGDPSFSGRMSEQFDRTSGYMRGAENLTWSYAAFGSAYRAYQEAARLPLAN